MPKTHENTFIMIKKVIHLADTHIPNSNDERPYDIMLKQLLSSIYKEIKNDNPEEVRIVIVGDIFHQKVKTTNEAKSMFHMVLNYLNEMGCRVYIIAGNHDLLERNTSRKDSIAPTFEINGAYPNIHYLDKTLNYKSGYVIDDNIVWALYSIYDKYAQPSVVELNEHSEGKTVVGLYHGDCIGAVTDVGYTSEDKGIDANYFSGCDCVMAGHIHKHQVLKKGGIPLVYAGSAIQQNLGENITGHGFVVWDMTKMKFKFKEVKNEYRLLKFHIDSYDDVKDDVERLMNL